jgi:hypothetical protein
MVIGRFATLQFVKRTMHYMMSCARPATARVIGQGPGLKTEPWVFGRKLAFAVPEPLIYTLEPGEGHLLPMYTEGEPLMRQDLVDALEAAGVDNLELYRAIVRDPVTGKEWHDYRAFNVLGLVAAAFENPGLGIDESRTMGLFLFRLAEAPTIIVVHKRVMEAVLRRAIPGIEFDAGEPRRGDLKGQ